MRIRILYKELIIQREGSNLQRDLIARHKGKDAHNQTLKHKEGSNTTGKTEPGT